MQFIEALQDDEGEDWSFVPEKILMQQLRKTPCWIYKKNEKGNTILVSTTKRHLRTKVLWKQGTISWYAIEALRLQNPLYTFLMYTSVPKSPITMTSSG